MKLRLKKLRKSKKYSQQDMADKLGVKIRTYASWERQENNLSLKNAIKIADVLDVSLDTLCGRQHKVELAKRIKDDNLRNLITNYNLLSEEYSYQLLSLSKTLVSNPENRNN